jgi:hypothetical protein
MRVCIERARSRVGRAGAFKPAWASSACRPFLFPLEWAWRIEMTEMIEKECCQHPRPTASGDAMDRRRDRRLTSGPARPGSHDGVGGGGPQAEPGPEHRGRDGLPGGPGEGAASEAGLDAGGDPARHARGGGAGAGLDAAAVAALQAAHEGAGVGVGALGGAGGGRGVVGQQGEGVVVAVEAGPAGRDLPGKWSFLQSE